MNACAALHKQKSVKNGDEGCGGCDQECVRLIPEGLPLAVGSEDSQVSDLAGMVVPPGAAGLLEAGLQQMAS